MKINLVSGGWKRNWPWATELAFKLGLEQAGHEVKVIDTNHGHAQSVERFCDASVVFKGAGGRLDIEDALRETTGPVFVYQPDDMHFDHIKNDMKQALQYCSHAILFEQSGCAEALMLGYKSASRIMLPVDTSFWYNIPVLPKVIDAVFVANISNEPAHASRRRMVDIVNASGLKTIVTTDFNTAQVNRLYNQSKIVLHHATDVGQPFGYGYGYQSRHFEAGFAGACVLSNEILSEEHITGLYTYRSERELVEMMHDIIRDGTWKTMGELYHREMHERHRPIHRAWELVGLIERVKRA